MQVQSLGWEYPLEEEWQPTPEFFPEKSHGQRSLVGCRSWGCKELDTTEHAHKKCNRVGECVILWETLSRGVI